MPSLGLTSADLWPEEKLHLDPGNLNQIVVIKLLRLPTEGRPVNGREQRALDVGDKESVRASGDHRHLYAGFADRGQILDQIERAASRST